MFKQPILEDCNDPPVSVDKDREHFHRFPHTTKGQRVSKEPALCGRPELGMDCSGARAATVRAALCPLDKGVDDFMAECEELNALVLTSDVWIKRCPARRSLTSK